MNRTLAIAFLAGLAVCPVARAQFFSELKPTWVFERHDYYDPLPSEPRAAVTKVLFPGRASSFPDAQHPGQSYVWDITVGDEIPILGWSNQKVDEGEPVPPHKWGLGVWFPLSFHMVEDMSKDDSAPILDTDYRFGGMIKFQYGLGVWRKLHRSHLGVRYVPIAHESTHIGDEYTLHAVKLYGNQFKRVNVSYQYWELGGSFETDFFIKESNLRLKLRGGLIHEAFHHGIGWYDAELTQPVGGFVTPSKRNIEPYAGADLFLSPQSHSYGPFISVDYRDRTIYGYDRPSRSIPEQTEGSVNAMAGFRHVRDMSRIRPSFYLRYYHGVNPAGQFRSQDNYQEYGFGALFEF